MITQDNGGTKFSDTVLKMFRDGKEPADNRIAADFGSYQNGSTEPVDIDAPELPEIEDAYEPPKDMPTATSYKPDSESKTAFGRYIDSKRAETAAMSPEERELRSIRRLQVANAIVAPLLTTIASGISKGRVNLNLGDAAGRTQQALSQQALDTYDNLQKRKRREAYGSAASQIDLPDEYKPMAPIAKVMASEDPEKFVTLISNILSRQASRPQKTEPVQYSQEALDAASSGDFSKMTTEFYGARGTAVAPPKANASDPSTWDDAHWEAYKKKRALDATLAANAAAAAVSAKTTAEADAEGKISYTPGIKLREGFATDPTTTTKVKAAAGNYGGARKTLDRMAGLYKEKGIRPVGELAREYQSLVTQLQLDIKGDGFAQLGVLAGPDMDILMNMVPDPTSWSALAKKSIGIVGDPIQPKLDAARRYLDNQFSSKINANGFEISNISELLGKENRYFFKSEADMQAAYDNGELMKGSTVYVGGKPWGKVE